MILGNYAMIVAVCSIVILFSSGCAMVAKTKVLSAQDPVVNECVIVLHGLGRTNRSMSGMQQALSRAGYHTVNLDYPSRQQSIEELAKEYIPSALEQCDIFNPQKIHFVTHSMGGIVVRMAIKQHRPEKLGRVVMLSPPNRGSEAVNHLKKRWFYCWVNGPAGQELSTAEDSVPNQLGPVDYQVGIITGKRQALFDLWLVPFFRGINDGKVSVECARLDGMTDFIVVQESHSFIMDSPKVWEKTIQFLQQGHFLHDDEK